MNSILNSCRRHEIALLNKKIMNWGILDNVLQYSREICDFVQGYQSPRLTGIYVILIQNYIKLSVLPTAAKKLWLIV